MLTRDVPVVVDESLHRFGQLDDLDISLYDEEVTEESIVEQAEPDARIAAEVLHLHRRRAGADDDVVPVGAHGDRSQRWPAVRPQRRDNSAMVVTDPRDRVCGSH